VKFKLDENLPVSAPPLLLLDAASPLQGGDAASVAGQCSPLLPLD
jgi:hypothetical protein